MSKITGQTYKSIPAVLNYTITSQDVTDSYVTVEYDVDLPLAAIVSCTNQNGSLINMNTAKKTYPANGQVKIEASGVGIAEKTTITTVADVANSLGGKYLLLSSYNTDFYAWFDSTGVAEISKVVTIADTDGSLGGVAEVNEISSVDAIADTDGSLGGKNAVSEITSVDTVADVAGSLGGKNAVAEVSSIDTVADVAGSLAGKYFDIFSGTSGYRCWYKVSGSGSAPADGGNTLTEIDISTGDTSAAVATATKAVLDAIGGAGVTFSCVIGGAGSDEMTITNVVAGASTDASAGDSGFTVGTDTQGSDQILSKYFDINSTTVAYRVWYSTTEGTAPDLTGKTGVQVTILMDDTAAAVATATKTALDAVGGAGTTFSCVIAGAGNDEMTITHVVAGVCTDAADSGSTTFTIGVDTQGAAQKLSKYFDISSTTVNYRVWYNASTEGTAPDLTGKTGVEVAITRDDLASAVATATETALEALGGGGGAVFDVTIAGAGSDEMTITHTVAGACTDTADGNTTFTIATDTQGVTAVASKYFDISSPTVNYRVWYNDGEGAEPALAGRTGVEVTIIKNETIANVATKTKAVLDALGTGAVFSTVIAGAGNNEMTITNLVRGLATDAAAGTSGFAVTTLTQGVAKSTDPNVASRTAIEIPLVTGDSANTVATKLRAVLEAHAAFTASVVNNVVTVTNSVVGKATDASAGNSGMTISISDQGVSVSNALVFEAGNKLTVMAFRNSAL